MADRAARPRRLAPGDAVAVLSPSWGGPATFPHVYERGLDVLRAWGLEIRESPSTRAAPERLWVDPRARADDVNAAFGDPSIRAVLATIGGEDSIRLLPFLDGPTIAANPKIVMGYSDTTVLLAAVRRLGVVAFHGPSVMAGISQLDALPEVARRHVHDMLFEPAEACRYPDLDVVVHGYPDWRDPTTAGRINEPRPAGEWRVLQGAGRVTGELYGGCLEVLDWLRGTNAWPAREEWGGRLLLLEPSEEKPPPLQVERVVRAFGALGVFERDRGVVGVLLGRPRDHTPEETAAFEAAVRDVIADELGRTDLPIVGNLPFGHTDPQWVLPIGVRAELDIDAHTLTLVEPWLD